MADYYFGHPPVEMERLIAQSVVLRPITERLLRAAGLKPGMRVLDIGCGAGDVSMLVADLVGPAGRVVGIDLAETAVKLSAHRAMADGYRNIAFHHAESPAFAEEPAFDLVIGRYVVLHQVDPAPFIRQAAARLRPGGTIAFHEIDMRSRCRTLPAAPLFDQVTDAFLTTFGRGFPSPDAAGRLVALFVEAGLPVPQVICERPAGGGDHSPIYRWCAACATVARFIDRPGEPPLDIDTVEAELREAVTAVNAQILGPDQCCAWARLD